MKTLITSLLIMLSVANFAQTSISYSNDNAKPKRPPISDDGPIWPPVPLHQ